MPIKFAHAMGSINGYTYTNSLAAFKKNYNEGIRYFEVDIELFSDGTLVCFHNQKEDRKLYRLNKPSKHATSEEALKFNFSGSEETLITPLSIEKLFELIQQYDDCYFIIDIKRIDKRNTWRYQVAKMLLKLPSSLRISIYRFLYAKKIYLAEDLSSNLAFAEKLANIDSQQHRVFIQANLDNFALFESLKCKIIWRKKRGKWLKVDPIDARHLEISLYSVFYEDLTNKLTNACKANDITICVYGHPDTEEKALLNQGYNVYSDLK